MVTAPTSVPQFVLASASPRRRDLLAQAGYQVRLAPTAVAESSAGWLTARELVLLNAGRKATAAAGADPDNLVLGVDTLVSLHGQPLGKPADRAAAAAMLESLAGREHQVYSGVCLLRLRPARAVSFVAVTRVRFRRLSSAGIAAYLRLVDPLDKAGGYAAQEYGERIITSMTGSQTNVMGLPMEELTAVLAREFAILPVQR